MHILPKHLILWKDRENLLANHSMDQTRKARGSKAKERHSSPSSLPSTCSAGRTIKKLSTDPQSVAARQRRHRISDRFKTLRSLVPGAHKMDTVSMLDGAIRYVKFLEAQIRLHQQISLFYGGHLAIPTKDPYMGDDVDCRGYFCHCPSVTTTAEISFSGGAVLISDQSADFQGIGEANPSNSLQLQEFPEPDSYGFGEDTRRFYEGYNR